MSRVRLLVTLENSDNGYLAYPVKGLLEFFEIGCNGHLSVGVFRRLKENGEYSCPCVVKNCIFSYGKSN